MRKNWITIVAIAVCKKTEQKAKRFKEIVFKEIQRERERDYKKEKKIKRQKKKLFFKCKKKIGEKMIKKKQSER